MRARALEPRLSVRALNFMRLMSLSSAPIFLKLPSTPSMRRVARSSISSSSSSEGLTSSLTMRVSRPALSSSLQDLLENDRVVGERLVDLGFALLDALGDPDLALAVEQLDRPHLAQVHAHGVVGLLDGLARFLRRLGLEGRAAPRGAVRIRDDLDAEVEEPRVDLFEVLGAARDLVGKDRLHLLVEQIALLLAHLQEDLDLGVTFLNHQARFLSETASSSAIHPPPDFQLLPHQFLDLVPRRASDSALRSLPGSPALPSEIAPLQGVEHLNHPPGGRVGSRLGGRPSQQSLRRDPL